MIASIIAIILLTISCLVLSVKLYQVTQKNKKSENSSFSDVLGSFRLSPSSSSNQEKEMLKSVLDLGDVEVYDVMNHRKNLFAVDINLPTEKIIEKVKDCPFSRIPIYKDKLENIVGILRVRELLREAFEKKDNIDSIKIEEIMTKPWFIPESTNLKQQLQLFRARREHFAFVVDEYGVLQGIVTLEDILEEIVGEINDELDIQSIDIMGIKKIDDKSLLIDGQVPIRDLNRRYGWDLEDENAVTIAGYLLDMTQSIPNQGQKFIFDCFEFEVVKRSKNQLVSIKLTPPAIEKDCFY